MGSCGTTVVTTDADLTLQVAAAAKLEPGASVSLFVKIEKVRLTHTDEAAASAPNRIACQVKDVILRGANADYILAFGKREISASRPRAEAPFAPGDTVIAEWAPADIDAFPDAEDAQ